MRPLGACASSLNRGAGNLLGLVFTFRPPESLHGGPAASTRSQSRDAKLESVRDNPARAAPVKGAASPRVVVKKVVGADGI